MDYVRMDRLSQNFVTDSIKNNTVSHPYGGRADMKLIFALLRLMSVWQVSNFALTKHALVAALQQRVIEDS
jgi:hypothetical protein